MTGLPGDTPETLEKTVRGVLKIHPDMLRITRLLYCAERCWKTGCGTEVFSRWDWIEAVGQSALVFWHGWNRLGITGHSAGIARIGYTGAGDGRRCLSPRFPELCESRLIREKVDRELGSFAAGSRILLRVSSKDVPAQLDRKRQIFSIGGRWAIR